VRLALEFADEHGRLADRQLEALAAHDLSQHCELELAATLHLPGVRPLGGENAEGDVADELRVEPRLHLAGG
jgi:hypothetical protein